ncbi:general odorant-binding protein 72-like [Photinus pyralis]|uniref:general odorant-binding protein 72-like n=1 Tax=Photinus pyralis TaxID=7054 RepID=UPI001266F3DE|nr:general odorant-binding protein 72-like [Photinus pyralis]
MKLLFFITVLIASCHHVYCVMTEAQMQSAAKMLRNVCQPKAKISAEQLSNLQVGQISDEPEVLSYIECVLRTSRIMKDGQFNVQSAKTQIANLPSHISEPGMITIENCKDAAKSSDKYIAAAELYKCFYDDNPENFAFP